MRFSLFNTDRFCDPLSHRMDLKSATLIQTFMMAKSLCKCFQINKVILKSKTTFPGVSFVLKWICRAPGLWILPFNMQFQLESLQQFLCYRARKCYRDIETGQSGVVFFYRNRFVYNKTRLKKIKHDLASIQLPRVNTYFQRSEENPWSQILKKAGVAAGRLYWC